MSPIRVSPEREVYISSDPEKLSQVGPTSESRVVSGEVYVLPCGKNQHYIVKVKGFSKAPGGMVVTERLTSGNEVSNISLTTPDDEDLSGELGVTAVKIDGVVYEATEVGEGEGIIK